MIIVSVLLLVAMLAGCAISPSADSPASADASCSAGDEDLNARYGRYTRKQAEDGNRNAQFRLANMYRDGKCGFDRDRDRARGWYRRAADADHAGAMLALGELHFAESDYRLALFWFQQAADEAEPAASYRIAQMYETGRGVPTNPGRARLWMAEAAARGHRQAREWLRARDRTSPQDAANDDWKRYYDDAVAGTIASAPGQLGEVIIHAANAEPRASFSSSGDVGPGTVLGGLLRGGVGGTLGCAMYGAFALAPVCGVVFGLSEAMSSPNPIDKRRMDIVVEQIQIAHVISSLLPVRVVEHARAQGIGALRAESATELPHDGTSRVSAASTAATRAVVRVEEYGWQVRSVGDSYWDTFRVIVSLRWLEEGGDPQSVDIRGADRESASEVLLGYSSQWRKSSERPACDALLRVIDGLARAALSQLIGVPRLSGPAPGKENLRAGIAPCSDCYRGMQHLRADGNGARPGPVHIGTGLVQIGYEQSGPAKASACGATR